MNNLETLSIEEQVLTSGGDVGDFAYAVGWVVGRLIRYSGPMGGANLAIDIATM